MSNSTYPIALISIFKSGTEMTKKILEDLTGLPHFEPPIIPGHVNYQDAEQFYHPPGHFYAWHIFPTVEVQKKIVDTNTKIIFLLRNIYDLTVSMYYHFLNNVDADVGRGRNVDSYFRDMNKSEGLRCIINGMTKTDFIWRGIGPHLYQMTLMLEFSEKYPCYVTTYERITSNKSDEIRSMANYMGIPITKALEGQIIHNSDFDTMKTSAIERKEGSHFRKGKPGSHAEELESWHIQHIQSIMNVHAPRLPLLVERAGISEVTRLLIPAGSQ